MAFSDPGANIRQLALREGMRVADFGAGSGHYAAALARSVHDTGHVYVVDIQKELLDRITKLAQSQGADTIEAVWGDIETEGGSRIASESLDAVVMSNVLFQLEHRNAAATEAWRVLKPGGKLLVIDWTDSFGGLGPRPGDIVTSDAARALFEDVGFSAATDVPDAGDHHWGIVFTKPA